MILCPLLFCCSKLLLSAFMWLYFTSQYFIVWPISLILFWSLNSIFAYYCLTSSCLVSAFPELISCLALIQPWNQTQFRSCSLPNMTILVTNKFSHFHLFQDSFFCSIRLVCWCFESFSFLTSVKAYLL